MRKLKVNEEELKGIIEDIINENFLGISIKNLHRELERYGYKVSPQIIRRNIIKLTKERKIRFKQGKLKHG